MPSSDSQAFLRELIKSDDTPVVRREILATRVPPLPTPSNSPSASLGDLCAFAFQNSSKIFDFGKEPVDTFTSDQNPDFRADFVMALPSAATRSLQRNHPADRPNGRTNPPFNIKEWWDGKLEGNARWNRSKAELASHAKFYKN